MKVFTLAIVLLLMLVGNVGVVADNTLYSGSMSIADGGLSFFSSGPTNWTSADISWLIAQDNPLSPQIWHYKYTITITSKKPRDFQHAIIGVDSLVTTADILEQVVNGTVYTGASIRPVEMNLASAPYNEGMPSDLWGMDFTGLQPGATQVIELYTPEMPVWGDFYARSVNTGSNYGAIWNSQFGQSSPNGYGKIPVVPEPGTLAAACALLAPASLLFRRKRVFTR